MATYSGKINRSDPLFPFLSGSQLTVLKVDGKKIKARPEGSTELLPDHV